MNTREVYKQKYEAQMNAWSAKLDALAAQAEVLTAKAKLDVKPHLDRVREKFKAVGAKVDDMAGVTDEKLESMVEDAGHAWSEFKASVEGAYDAIAKHDPKS